MLALLGLKPWEPSESIPRLGPPALEAGVGDAVALPAVAPAVAVVEAAVAPGRATLASRPRSPREGDGAAGAPAAGPALAVAVPAGEPGPEPAPPPTTTPAPAPSPAGPAPESPPAAAPAPELASAPPAPGGAAPEAKTPGGPISAGGPEFEGEEEACEGDEYTIVIVPLPDTQTGEEATVELVVRRLNEDGSVDELRLEGDPIDAQNLLLQLISEGNCVQIEAGSATTSSP